MEENEEISHLKLMVGQLKELIRDKDSEVQAKNNAIKDAESKLSKSRIQLKAKEAKISSLNKELKAKGVQQHLSGASTSDVTSSLQSDVIRLRTTNEGNVKIIKEQKMLLHEQELKYENLQAEINKKYEEKVEERDGKDTSRKLEELSQIVSNKDHVITSLSSQLEEVQRSLSQREEHSAGLETKLLESETLVEQQKLILNKLSVRVEEQEEKVAMVTEERSTGISHMQDDLGKLTVQVSTLTSKLLDKEGTVAILEEHILQQKREHEAQLVDLTESNQEQDELLRSLKRRMHEQEEVMSGKEKVLQLLQDEASDRIQEHQELQKTISILQQNLRETVESKDLLQEALKTQEKGTEQVQEQKNNTTEIYEKENAIIEKDNIIAQLNAGLQQYEAAYRQAGEQNTAFRNETATLKERIQTLEESVEKWREFAETSSESFKVREGELKSSLHDMEGTITNLTEELSNIREAKVEQAEDNEKRMQTVLAELDSQTLVLENQTKELNNYREENSKLKDDSKQDLVENEEKMDSQLRTLLEKNHTLEISVEKLQERMQEREIYISDVSSRLTESCKTVEELKIEISSKDVAMKQVEEENKSTLKERESLMMTNEELQEDMRRLQTENESVKEIEQFLKEELEKSSSNWKEERANLLLELQKVETRCREEMRESNEELASRLSASISKVNDLDNMLTSLSEEKTLTEEKLEETSIRERELKETFDQLLKDKGNLDAQMRIMDEREEEKNKERMLEMTQSLQKYQEEIEDLRNKLNDSDVGTKKLEDELDDLKLVNSKLLAEKQEAENHCKMHQEELDSFKKTSNDSTLQNRNLEEELMHLTKTLDVVKQDSEEKASSLLKAENRNSVLSESCETLKNQIEEESRMHEEEIAKRESSITVLKNEKEILVNEFNTVKSQFDEKIDVEKTVAKEYELILGMLSNNVEEMKNELSEARSEQDALEVNLEDKNKETSLQQEKILQLQLAYEELEKGKTTADNRANELGQLMECEKSKQEELEGRITSLAAELERVHLDLEHKEAESSRREDLLKKMSTKYASLKSELDASKLEYENLMKEMNGSSLANQNEATQEDDTMNDQFSEALMRQLLCFIPDLEQSRMLEEGHQSLIAYFKAQATVESKLHETEEKLQQVENERDDAVHEASLLKRLKRETSHNYEEGENLLQFVEEPRGNAHKGGLEYLQSQLEELANEQQQQEAEHQQVTASLNSQIEKLSIEEEQLQEAYDKQSVELDEILKSYKEKVCECQQLNSVISEQQHDLTHTQQELLKLSKSSSQNQKTLHDIEDKFLLLQEKHKVASESLESTEEAKQELELELREIKSSHKDLQDQYSHILEQAEKKTDIITNLQQDLDQTMEQVEVVSSQYKEETTKLKSMLREKDEEISSLRDDLAEKSQEVSNLSHSLKERNTECVDLEDTLTAQTQKVGQLESLIRQQETELMLISELEGAKEEAVIKAKQLTDYVTKLEQKNNDNDQTMTDLMKKIESLQSQLIEREGALERLSRESSRIQESNQKREDEKESHLTDTENQLLALQQQLTQAGQAINSLTSTVEKKDEELTHIKESNSQFEFRLSEVQEELASMQQLLKDKEEGFRQQMILESEKLEKMKSEHCIAEEILKDELQEISNKYSQLKENSDSQSEEVRGLTLHLEKQMEEIEAHHKAKTEQIEEEVTELHEKIRTISEEKEKAVSELFCSREETENLREKVEILEKWESEAQEKSKLCQELESTCSLLDERLKETSAKLREQEQQATSLQGKFDEATEKVTEKERLVKQLDEELTLSSSEIRKLKDALSDESERQIKEMDSMMSSRIEERENHIKQLESEKANMLEQLNSLANDKEDLNKSQSKLEDELSALKEQHSTALQMIEQKANAEAEQYGAEINRLNTCLVENQEKLDELLQDREQNTMKDDAWVKTCSDLESQLCETRDELENSKLNLSTTMEKEQNLTCEISKLSEQLNESKESEEKLKDMTAKHEAHLDKAKKIIRGLQVQLKQGKEKIENLEKEKGDFELTSQEKHLREEDEAKEKSTVMSNRIEELQKEANVYKSKLEESSFLTTSLKEQLLASVQNMDTLQQQSSANAVNLQKIIELQKEIESGKNFQKDAQEKCESLKAELSQVTEECGKWKNETERVIPLWKNAESDKEREIEETQIEVNSLKESNASLNSKLEELMTNTSITDSLVQELQLNLQKKEESIAELEKERDELVNILQEKITEERNNAEEKSHVMLDKVNELEKEVAVQKSHLEESTLLSASLKEQLLASVQGFDSLQKESVTKEESLQEELNNIKLAHKETEGKYETLNSEMYRLNEECEKWKNEVERGTLSLKDLESQLRNAEEVSNSWKEKGLELEKMISEKENEMEQFKSEFAFLKESTSTLNAKNEELIKVITEKEALLANQMSSSENAECLLTEIMSLKSMIVEKQSELESSSLEAKELRDSVQAICLELKGEKEQAVSLKENIQNLTDSYSEKEIECRNAVSESEVVKSSISDKEKIIQELEERLNSFSLQSQHDLEATEHIAMLESKSDAVQEAFKEKNLELQKLQEIYDELNEKLNVTLSERDQDKVQKDSLQNEINDLSKKIDELSEESKNKDAEKSAMEKILNSTKEELLSSENRLSEITTLLNDREEDIKMEKTKIESLLQESRSSSDLSETLKNQLEEKMLLITQLEEDLNEKDEALAYVKDDLAKSHSKVNELNLSLQQITEDKDQYERKTSEMEEMSMRLQLVLEQKQEELDEALRTKESLREELAKKIETVSSSGGLVQDGMQTSNTLSGVTSMNNNNNLTDSSSDLAKESVDWEVQLQDVQSQLAEKSKALFEAQRKLKASLLSRKKMIEKLNTSEKSLKDFQETVHELEATNTSLMEEKESLNNSLQSISSTSFSAEESQSGMADLMNEKEELQNRITELEKQKLEMHVHVEEISSRFQSESANLTNARDVAFESLKDKEEEVELLNQQLLKIREEIDEARASESILTEKMSVLELSHAEEAREMQGMLDNLNFESQKQEEVISSLHSQVKTFESSEEFHKTELITKSEEITELQNKLIELEDLKNKLENDISQKAEVNNELLRNIESLNSVSILESQVTEANANDNLKLDAEVEQLKKEISENEIEKAELKDELIEIRKELESSTNKIKESFMQCENLKMLLSEAEKWKTEVDDINIRLQNSLAQCEELEMNKISMNERFSEKETEMENVKSELSSVEGQRECLETEIVILKSEKKEESLASVTIEQMSLLQKSNDDTLKEKDQLQRKLKAALVSRKELILQEKQLRETIEEEKSCQRDLESKYEDSLKLLEETKNELRDKEDNLSKFQDQVKFLENTERENQEKIRQLEASKDGEASENKENMKKQEIELKELQEALKSRDSDVSTLESCNTDLNDMVTAIESKKKILEKKMEEMMEEIRSLNKQIKTIHEEKEVSGISREDLEDLQDKLAAAEWDKETMEEKIRFLQEEKKEKSSLLDKVLADFERESIARQELQSKCEQYEEKLMNLKSEESNSEEKMELEAEIEKLRSQIADIQSTPKDDDAHALQEENENLKSSISEMKDELQKWKEPKILSSEQEKDSHVEKDEAATIDESQLSVGEHPVLDQDLMLARKELLDETLKQLKSTQPECWEQEPGIKKLIDKLEYLAGKAGTARKEARNWEEKCESAAAHASSLERQLDSSNESCAMQNKTVEQQQEEISGMKKTIIDLQLEVEDAESLKIQLIQLRKDCDYLNSSLQKEKTSYEQVQHRIEADRLKMKKVIQDLEDKEKDMKSSLEEKCSEYTILEEHCKSLDAEKISIEDELKRFQEVVSRNKDYIFNLEEERKHLHLQFEQNQVQLESKSKSSMDVHADETLARMKYLQESKMKLEEEMMGMRALLEEDQEKLSSSQKMVEDLKQRIGAQESSVKSSSSHSVSDMEESYLKLLDNIKDGNLNVTELQNQHQALVQELISKEEDLSSAKMEIVHLSSAYDELLQKLELSPSQALQVSDSKSAASDTDSLSSQQSVQPLHSAEDENLAQVSFLTKELGRREALVSELVSDCTRLKHDLEHEKKIVETLKIEVEEFRAQAKSLACLKTQYEANENHLKSELAEKDKVILRQRDELEYSRKEQSRLRDEFGAGSPEEVQVVLSAYLEDIHILKEKLLSKTDDVTKKTNLIEQLEEEDESRKNEMVKISLELEALSDQGKLDNSLIESLQEECDLVKNERDGLLKEMDDLKDVRESLHEKDEAIKELTSQRDEVSAALIEKESKLVDLQKEEERLNLELKQIKADLLDTTNNFTSFVQTAKERQKRLDVTERSLSSITGDLAALESKYSSGTSLLDQIRRDVPSPNVVTETLVQSAARQEENGGRVKSLTKKNLEDKNPLVRLQRKLEAYEETLNWMNQSNKGAEEQNQELRSLYENLRIDYNEKVSELGEIQTSLSEAGKKLDVSEKSEKIAAEEVKNIRIQLASELREKSSDLEAVKSALIKSEQNFIQEKEKAEKLDERIKQSQEQTQQLNANFKNAQDRIHILESDTDTHIQKMQSSEHQLQHLLTERQQLAGQINSLHSNLQEYQSRYSTLHSEYVKISELHEKCGILEEKEIPKESHVQHDTGAPGGPPVGDRDSSGSPEHSRWQQSLRDVNSEKKYLTSQLAQMGEQLTEEIQRRVEVEELLTNLRKNMQQGQTKEISLDMGNVLSDEEEPILQRPTSVTRKIQLSTSSSCSRWLRGRSLRWAKSSKSGLCRHFRPLSVKTLALIYLIALHILTIKCFLTL